MTQPQTFTQLESAKGIANMIMIASGKGGVGKTWFSITLGMTLAKKGKKVLLFDGDLGMANVDIQLGLTPEKDLGDYIQQTCALKDVIVNYQANFDLLVGRSGCGSLASLSQTKLDDLKRELVQLSTQYDYVLLDLGAGIGGTVRQLSQLAGQCFLMTTDEPTAITDAYAFLKYTASSHPTLDLRLVVNQSPSTSTGMRTYETLQKVSQNFLKYELKLAGIIPEDKNIPDAIRHQEPLWSRYPTSHAIQAIQRVLTQSGIKV